MPCQYIQLDDGSWFRVRLAKRGAKLTERDIAALKELARVARDEAVSRSPHIAPGEAGARTGTLGLPDEVSG